MATGFSIALSVFALLFSVYVLADSHRRDKRDILIKMHELLTSDRYQRGRYLLFEKVIDEASVERLSGEDYRDINGAISGFSLLGLYVEKGYVNEQDVLDAWSISIARAWESSKPFIAHGRNKRGYTPHHWFGSLAIKAQEYLNRQGINLDYTPWRRANEPGKPG